jgi:hypothetical protein
MNRGRVGEERRGKEMDGCPLTAKASLFRFSCRNCQMTATRPDYDHNQLDLRLQLGSGVSSGGCSHQESVYHPNQLQLTGTGCNQR